MTERHEGHEGGLLTLLGDALKRRLTRGESDENKGSGGKADRSKKILAQE